LKILDANGAVIPTIERAKNGAIVVKDDGSLNKYLSEKKQATEVVELRDKVKRLESLVEQLLKKHG
jgi:hypothetical protein